MSPADGQEENYEEYLSNLDKMDMFWDDPPSQTQEDMERYYKDILSHPKDDNNVRGDDYPYVGDFFDDMR